MDVIRWDCGEQIEQQNKYSEFNSKLQAVKDKLVSYKALLENQQISEEMLTCGEHELSQEMARLIIEEDPDQSYNLETYNFEFSDEMLSETNKALGQIGVLCPKCNAIYANSFTDDETPIMQDTYLYNADKIGTRMHLKNGKFGKFWGCMNYPNCKSTLSTSENKRKNASAFKAMTDYDLIYDDYVPDIF